MLIKPLISEKSLALAAKGRYTFRVEISDNKLGIKEEVEKRFGVNVVSVKTLIIPGKTYRSGKKWMFGQRTDKKKAIVQLKKDQKIDLFETTK